MTLRVGGRRRRLAGLQSCGAGGAPKCRYRADETRHHSVMARWRRRWKHDRQAVSQGADRDSLVARFEAARSRTATVMMYMCWHDGRGHEYPIEVMKAAARLRDRHGATTSSDDDYTMLFLRPTDADWEDFLLVLPYCDWAYAADETDDLVAEAGSE
jgi:hypothetical protein